MYEEKTIALRLIVTTAVFMLLAAFIIAFLMAYKKRQKKNIQEKTAMETAFREELLQAQLEIQEQTLKNISQEIHDNIGQVLSLAKLHLATIDSGGTHPEGLKIIAAKDLVSKAIQDLRHLSHNMHAEYVSKTGLVGAIQIELDLVNKVGELKTALMVEGIEYRFQSSQEFILFRLFQESVNNALKHACANIIQVKLLYYPDRFEMEISDDGKGFDLNLLESNDKFGLGIKNMHNRAKLIKATFNIESTFGGGTILKWSILLSIT